MRTSTRLPRPIALAVAAAGFAAAAAEVPAQIACGATINQGETVTLTSDLGPCDGVEGAVLLQSGILDLGGHTVSCADTNGDGSVPDGVVLLGRKAQVRNGTVTGCDYDVYVGGAGKHTVEGVTTTAAVVYGFYVASDSGKNRLAGNTASANLDDGFQIRGPKNKVEGNVANGNGEDGIDLTQAKANKITANTTTNNVDDGIEATGTKNKIVGNTSTGNGDFGIAVGDRGNKVVGNTATGNGSADIIGQEPCKGNKFKNNTFGSGSSCVK